MGQHDNGIYYFLGNITSHILHAMPLFREIGGTFVVSSKLARRRLEQYGVPALCIDNVPFVWRRDGKLPHKSAEYTSLDKRFEKTADFLNMNAEVIIFYELFDLSSNIKIDKPKKIFLTHGNMLKNYFKMYPRRLEIIKQYDFMAALGPFMKQEFINSGIDSKKLIDVGIARTDDVVSLSARVSLPDRLKNIGVPSNKPIVSYLPTFWGDSSLEKLGVRILEQISNEFTVLFRPHPQTPEKILKKYDRVCSKDNVFYIPELGDSCPSLLDVYAASSIIIGDASSVMLEAILLDKPLLFAQPDTVSNPESHNQLDGIKYFCNEINDDNINRISEIINHSIKVGIDDDLWEKTKDSSFFNHDRTSVKEIANFIKSLL